MIFKKPTNSLEGQSKQSKSMNDDMGAMQVNCPRCKKNVTEDELKDNKKVCPYCRNHFRINPRERIHMICDEGSFKEHNAEITSHNLLDFPDYDKKLNSARLDSGEKEGVTCGTARIAGIKTAIFVMNPFFMMGSMGHVVGEKITRLFEYATERNLPVIGYTVSGGARMQEGIISLMQMAKTSGAVKRHSDNGNLFACVLTDPTTGGVTASFAMEADIIIAEPKALVAFAGPRVIEQTIRKKLPEGFQQAEFLVEKGFVDIIVDRKRQRSYLAQVLKIHHKEDK